MSDFRKILFVQQIGDNIYETESLWCKKDGEYYVVDNIAFVAKRISAGDTIKAEYDEDEKAFYFDDFVRVSGNSTVRLYFENENIIEDVRKRLK